MRGLINKTVFSLFVIVIISVLVFFAFQILPGDPVSVILGTEATPERVEQLTQELNLDETLAKRYTTQVLGMLKGDFGNSIKFQQPINEILADRLPITLSIGFFSMILIILITIPIGIMAGSNYNGFFGKTILAINNIFTAIPSYFLSVIITIVFGLMLRFFQSGNFVPFGENPIDYIKYLFFPSLAIALPNAAMLIKFLSSSIDKELNQSYVRTARSKGASEFRIMFHHVFKNSILSTITLFGMIVADIFCGSIVVEQIFNIPGIGRLLISSISARDFPLLQVITIFIATIVVSVNLLVDIMLTIIDPRIKTS